MTPQNPSPLLTARIQPETEPWGFNFGFLAPKPPPCLVLSDAGPRRRRHLFHTLPPPRPIAPHRHFQRRARNRAVALDFVGFVPNPLPSPCTSNPTTNSSNRKPFPFITLFHIFFQYVLGPPPQPSSQCPSTTQNPGRPTTRTTRRACTPPPSFPPTNTAPWPDAPPRPRPARPGDRPSSR